MVEGNVASSGAHQSNVGLDFAMVKFNIYQPRGPLATIAIAQQARSPLFIRPAAHPLDSIPHLTDGTEITPKHFHGRNIYHARAATFINETGDAVISRMDMIRNPTADHEPDWMDTMIICLSIFMNTTDLSNIMSRALLLSTHGCTEARLKGDFGILTSFIVRHAAQVLQRDSMCDKLKFAKEAVQREAKRAGFHWNVMFLPPRSRSERSDFVELLAQIMSAPSEETTIYTRSVKLMGLAHLLVHYGWQIGILVQDNHGIKHDLVGSEPGPLSVVLSFDDATDRDFIETHTRQRQHDDFEAVNAHSYTTTPCEEAQWRENSALIISVNAIDELLFLKWYNDVRKIWDMSVQLEVSVLPQGQLFAKIKTDFWDSRVEQAKTQPEYSEWWRERFAQQTRVHKVEAMTDLLSKMHPDFDWGSLSQSAQECLIPTMHTGTADHCHLSVVLILQLILETLNKREDLTRYMILGAILAILDEVVCSLVRVPKESLVRIPVGESVEFFIHQASDYLEALFDSDRGLHIDKAVVLCAARLAGVNPKDPNIPKTTTEEDIIGYWNGQQGILLTPILKRSLLWDLPQAHRKPLTLYNHPVLGVPTDSGGWIKAGATEQRPFDRELERFTSMRRPGSTVILQYRAHFEQDPSELVAAVYINGVFYNLTDFHVICFRAQDESRPNGSPLPLQLVWNPLESSIPAAGSLYRNIATRHAVRVHDIVQHILQPPSRLVLNMAGNAGSRIVKDSGSTVPADKIEIMLRACCDRGVPGQTEELDCNGVGDFTATIDEDWGIFPVRVFEGSRVCMGVPAHLSPKAPTHR
ncbi:hypothetical protein N0V82_010716 [Gnomoniopsis sp. IMI 355080]|nr:hypothetical protein N0V82_010716 [Gnomoniopsis sp. IMI 355080]